MIVLALLLASLTGTAEARDRRARLHETSRRLGVVPVAAPAGSLRSRLAWIERTYGERALAAVEHLLPLLGAFGAHLDDYDPRGPLYGWIAAQVAQDEEAARLVREQPGVFPWIRDWWAGATPRPDLAPLSVPAAFHAAIAWHRDRADRGRDAHGSTLLPGTVVYTDSPTGLVAHQLTTRLQLEAEGDAMGNCVGTSHADEVLRGRERIYSLRTPAGRPVVDVAIEPAASPGGPGFIREVKGRGNLPIAAKYLDPVLRFLVHVAGETSLEAGFPPDLLPLVEPVHPAFPWTIRARLYDLRLVQAGTEPLEMRLFAQFVREDPGRHADAVQRCPVGAAWWAAAIDGRPSEATARVAGRDPGAAVLYLALLVDPGDSARFLPFLREACLRTVSSALALAKIEGPRDDSRVAASRHAHGAYDYFALVDQHVPHPVTRAGVSRSEDLSRAYDTDVLANPPTREGLVAAITRAVAPWPFAPGFAPVVDTFLSALAEAQAVAADHGLDPARVIVIEVRPSLFFLAQVYPTAGPRQRPVLQFYGGRVIVKLEATERWAVPRRVSQARAERDPGEVHVIAHLVLAKDRRSNPPASLASDPRVVVSDTPGVVSLLRFTSP